MTKAVNQIRDALEDLVEVAIDSEYAQGIDAGWMGEGPVAKALVALGRFETPQEATDALIYPEDAEDGGDTE